MQKRGTHASGSVFGTTAEGTGLLPVQFGLVVIPKITLVGWHQVFWRFFATCPASFWDAEEGAVRTLCTHTLEGALEDYRGIMDRPRLV